MATINNIASKYAPIVRTFYVVKVEYSAAQKATVTTIKKEFHSISNLLKIVKLDAKCTGFESDFVEKQNEVIYCCYAEKEENDLQITDGSMLSIEIFDISRPNVIIWTNKTKEFPRQFRGLNSLIDKCREW